MSRCQDACCNRCTAAASRLVNGILSDFFSPVILESAVPFTKPDPVDHPSHYNSHPSGVEAITITQHYSFNVGNAIKYLWRAGLKSADPIEDLRKAAWYCAQEIKRLEADRARHMSNHVPGN
jgi:hypothetical protein